VIIGAVDRLNRAEPNCQSQRYLRMRISRTFALAILCVYLRDIYVATLSQSSGWFARDKRYLVYPPPGNNTPTKVQVYASL